MANAFIIFGASGDLTSRKLIPALYSLHRKGRLPDDTRVVGVSRTSYTDEQWRAQLAESTAKFSGRHFDAESWSAFAQNVHYQVGDIGSPDDFHSLARYLDQLDGDQPCTRVYYLSTIPKLYAAAVEQLGAAGLADESSCPRRIVIEKPFGTDLASAPISERCGTRSIPGAPGLPDRPLPGKRDRSEHARASLCQQHFRADLESHYIDNVQITVAEEVTVGRRGAYYDGSGVLRDMFQNHLLQLMMITAMEAPVRYEANLVRDEKVKVLQAIRPMHGADFASDTVRGRYQGYLKEEGVPADSQTATFAALKLHVDNWRWKNVPFYLRSGKGMSCRTTQIVIQFRRPPLMLFGDGRSPDFFDANRLVIQIQPAEGIQLHLQTKVPDAGMNLTMTDLDFSFQREFSGDMPDAYQRLLLDALNGDASLFARSDEVELAWQVIDPILAAWNSPAAPTMGEYELGQWGPDGSNQWMQSQGRQWFDVCPVLH